MRNLIYCILNGIAISLKTAARLWLAPPPARRRDLGKAQNIMSERQQASFRSPYHKATMEGTREGACAVGEVVKRKTPLVGMRQFPGNSPRLHHTPGKLKTDKLCRQAVASRLGWKTQLPADILFS